MSFTSNNNPICLFDSGLGGLTVLKKLAFKYPAENYIYLSDLANVPFGDKSNDEIKSIAKSLIEWLSTFNPKAIVLACNTSSSIVETHNLEPLQNNKVPVFGIIKSISREIAKKNHSKVSIWATTLTVKNNAYRNEINKVNSSITVEEIACPKLVPLIENLESTLSEKENIINEYLTKTSVNTEALILGCTHYPLVANEIKKLSNLEIIDPADKLIEDLSRLMNLQESNLHELETSKKITIYTTAQEEKVKKFSRLYLCGDFPVKLIKIKDLVK